MTEIFGLIWRFAWRVSEAATDTERLDSGSMRFMLENDPMW